MSVIINGTTGITTPALDSVAPFSSADMPAGSVLQVVSAVSTTMVSTTSASYTDAGLSVVITPTSSTSKILVVVNQHIRITKGTDAGYALRIVRDSTGVFERTDGSTANYLYAGSTGTIDFRYQNSMVYLDSPATTASTTYKTQFATYAGGTATGQHSSVPSTITLMEIAA